MLGNRSMTVWVALMVMVAASVAWGVSDNARTESIGLDPVRGTAAIVSGSLAKSQVTDLQQAAISYIGSRPDLFRMADPKSELRVSRQETDQLGYSHVRFDQIYQGLRVWGCQRIAHFDDKRSLYMVAGQTIPTPALSTAPVVSKAQAEAVTLQDVQPLAGSQQLTTRSELVVFPEGSSARLAWMVAVEGSGYSLVHRRVFVDAQDGKILLNLDEVMEDGPTTSVGLGVRRAVCTLQTYQIGTSINMIDGSRPMFVPPMENFTGVILTGDATTNQIVSDPNGDNVFDDDSAMQSSVSAHYNVGRAYEYFYDFFGRNGYDGNGASMTVVVHIGAINNAYSSGGLLQFGDGDGETYLPFCGDLDVVAHEFTHSVTSTTAGLIYSFQSGALSETFSDFFGCMADSSDWLIGNGIRLVEPRLLRSMSDPHWGANPTRFSYGCQPAHMNEFIDTPYTADNGGVHWNSGIPNKVGYLVGSTIGRGKAAPIWFRTLTTYLTPSSDFVFWAKMTEQAAIDLYGASSPELAAVAAAMDSVGLGFMYVTPVEVAALETTPTSVVDTEIVIRSTSSQTFSVESISTARGLVQVSGTVPAAVTSTSPATFVMSFNGPASFSPCLQHDTIILATSSPAQPEFRIPVAIYPYYAPGASTATGTATSSCLTTSLSGIPSFDRFERDAVNALRKASLMVGMLNGADTVVYMDFGDRHDYTAVDTLAASTLPNGDIVKQVRVASIDRRIQGRVKYQYEPTDVPGCGYVVADYSLINPCDTPLTIISGLLADFNLPDSNTNRAGTDASRKMVFIRDAGNVRACGLALLSGTPRNLRSINNTTVINSGFTAGKAYSELALTANTIGPAPDDWSVLLTFGQNVLRANDTAHYRVAMMYSTAGATGLNAILEQVNPVGCCIGTTGNVNNVGIVDLADLSALVSYLTGGGYVLPCVAEANINATSIVDLADLSSLVSYLTGGGYVLPNCPQ